MAFRLLGASLLCLMVLVGCRKEVSKKESLPINVEKDAECKPSFRRVSQEPMEVWIGTWKIGFEAFLVGCLTDLGGLQATDLDAIGRHLEDVFEANGLPAPAQSQDYSFRSRLAGDLNTLTGREAISDIVLITRYSIEYEPDLQSESAGANREKIRRFDWK